MTHFRLLSPNKRCQRQVPGGNVFFESFDADAVDPAVDEELGKRFGPGLLRLRGPRLPLLPLLLPLNPFLFTKFTSVSSSLKAAVKDEEEAVDDTVEGGGVDEVVGNDVT